MEDLMEAVAKRQSAGHWALVGFSRAAADIMALPDATTVLVGMQDSVLMPSALQSEFEARRSRIPVDCVSQIDHSELVTKPPALRAILATITGHIDSSLVTVCE
jgi:hypothetical protein